jgi:hypothetical protein
MPVGPSGPLRRLPPTDSLPGKVRDTITAYSEAAERARSAATKVAQARRVELPQAKQRDVEDAADALEAGKQTPERTHEERMAGRIAEMERQQEAAELVADRCRVRMDQAIKAHSDQIERAAAERVEKAKSGYLGALDALEKAVADLIEGKALAAWARDPLLPYTLRGLRRAPIVPASSDGVAVDAVIAALRQVLDPPQRPRKPSPFGGPAPTAPSEPAPAA